MEMAVISPIILSLQMARTVSDAATSAVGISGIPGCVSVVDGGGNLVLVTRMDGAVIGSISASIGKARAAVHFGASTFDLSDAAMHGTPMWATDASPTTGAFVAGGVPIVDARGIVVGGVGVGGGSPSQDHEAAAVGAAAGAAAAGQQS